VEFDFTAKSFALKKFIVEKLISADISGISALVVRAVLAL
jgi:hypothetical protein